MAKIRADRVKETSLFTGLNDIALLGAGAGFKAFGDVCQNGDTFDYAITHEGTSDWETGIGTYVSSTNTAERTTVTASSNSDAKVNFGSGYKQVFITVNGSSFAVIDNAATRIQATGLAIVFGA
jgi:hypothetical protein